MWEVKAAALTEVIGASWRVRDSIERTGDAWREERIAQALISAAKVAEKEGPGVAAYASLKCGQAFSAFQSELNDAVRAPSDLYMIDSLLEVRAEKEAAIDAQEFDKAAWLRDQEVKLARGFHEEVEALDLDSLSLRALKLITEARLSLQASNETAALVTVRKMRGVLHR